MADKLLIVINSIEPRQLDKLLPILDQAAVAAAMEYDVEVLLSGCGTALAAEGVAAEFPLRGERERTLYDALRETHEAGVKFKMCAGPSGAVPGPLIPEIHETVGHAYLISEAMDGQTMVFTY